MPFGDNDWLALTEDPPLNRTFPSAIPTTTSETDGLGASHISVTCSTS